MEPGTDACMSEQDVVTIFIFLKQLDAYADLALACPSVQVMTTEVEVKPVAPPTDKRKQI